jgi:hypothetical protein
MSEYKTLAINYLWHKALSDKEKARLSLDLLLENGVGIGDHSTGDYHKNLDEALDLLVDAEDRIETIIRYYGVANEGVSNADESDRS